MRKKTDKEKTGFSGHPSTLIPHPFAVAITILIVEN
jgi:hypothetical protein